MTCPHCPAAQRNTRHAQYNLRCLRCAARLIASAMPLEHLANGQAAGIDLFLRGLPLPPYTTRDAWQLAMQIHKEKTHGIS